MDKKRKFLLQTGRTIMKIFARMLLEFNVQYETSLQDGAKIFAPNHPTTSDPFLLSLVTPEPLVILVNKRVLLLPLIGSIIERAGTIPVDKQGGNITEVIHKSEQILQEKIPIGVFPEGCLSPEVENIAPLHTGLVRIALSTHTPIVPVGIYVHQRDVKHHQFHNRFGLSESRWILHGKYYVSVGKPLHVYGEIEDRDLVRRYTSTIAQEIDRLIMVSKTRAYQKEISWKPIIPFIKPLPLEM